MDKNTKNSFIFGAIVGGLYLLFKNAGKKNKMTSAQSADLTSLKKSFSDLQQLILGFADLKPTYKIIKDMTERKQYDHIVQYLSGVIETNNVTIFAKIDAFSNKLNFVLSTQFTAERANEQTHKTQVFFSKFKDFPAKAKVLVDANVAIMRLLFKAYSYINVNQSPNFKPEDSTELKRLVGQLQIASSNLSATLDKH